MAARRVVALALVLALSGGCALAGRSLGGYVDDKLVSGSVKRRLATEGMGRRAGVTVDTFGGVVYLTGAVDTEHQKSDAEIAAWRVGGVQQVVNDLVVREQPPSASPAPWPLHPLGERLPGVARLEPVRPGGPDLAYDHKGRVIATVYLVSSREVIDRNVETLRAEGRPVEHVGILPVVDPDLPAPHFAVVLWHISELEAAALR